MSPSFPVFPAIKLVGGPYFGQWPCSAETKTVVYSTRSKKHTHAYAQVHAHRRMHTGTCTRIHAQHSCTHTRAHAHMHTHMHAHIRVHTHAPHTHTCTLSPHLPPSCHACVYALRSTVIYGIIYWILSSLDKHFIQGGAPETFEIETPDCNLSLSFHFLFVSCWHTNTHHRMWHL